jgi:hypothetical protein
MICPVLLFENFSRALKLLRAPLACSRAKPKALLELAEF